MNKPLLVCRVAYMENYNGITETDKPKHGGSYVTEKGDAFEKFNFRKYDDGYCYGYVETKQLNGNQNKIHIEKIGANKDEEKVEGITVIFVALKEAKKTVVVGWYDNATVYRQCQKEYDRQFFIKCHIDNAHLIPIDKRSYEINHLNGKKGSIGQSNLWYPPASDKTKFFSYLNGISDISDDTNCPRETTCYIEGGKKQYWVTRYERSSENRRRAIDIHGKKCQVCGFDFESVYGELGKDFIEVHHVKPLASVDEEIPINPTTDLVCLCSNCHSMIHRKNGRVLTIEELKRIFKSRRKDLNKNAELIF